MWILGLKGLTRVSLFFFCRGFRLGFNSLCAYCSVNHLHFHVWYNKHPSYLETVVSSSDSLAAFYPASMLSCCGTVEVNI